MKCLLAFLLLLVPIPAFAQLLANCDINIPCKAAGVPSNTGRGDAPPVAFGKVNADFLSLQSLGLFSLQPPHYVLIGPVSGSSAASTFRLLVASDIPSLSYLTSVQITMPSPFGVSGCTITSSGDCIVTWTSPCSVAQGCTGVSTLTGYVYGNGTGNFTASSTIPYSALTGTPTIPTSAAASATVGPTATTGSGTAYMLANAAPALCESCNFTLTGGWTFSSTLSGTLTGHSSLDLALTGGTLTGLLTSDGISDSSGSIATSSASGTNTQLAANQSGVNEVCLLVNSSGSSQCGNFPTGAAGIAAYQSTLLLHSGSSATTLDSATVDLSGIPAGSAVGGYVCWTTGTGKLVEDTAATCPTSAERFKFDIRDLDEGALGEMMQLRPKAFRLKIEPRHPLQLGFIAEEVARVDPRLVERDRRGHPS
ncbi:MAG TPA: tail fiber domain-containing protein, partial [Steroidobacteraceae bacterium]